MVMAATMTTMHDDDDNEYDDLLSILLATKCQSAEVDQFGEFNDSQVFLGTIHCMFETMHLSITRRTSDGITSFERNSFSIGTEESLLRFAM